jgi:flagellar basal-body rod protein FlgB
MSSINLVTMDLANKSLDALWTRANTISNNISNSDTPNYKAKDVTFESSLSDALKNNTLSESQLNNITPQVVTVNGTVDANGNSVDMESQMVELTRNQLQYNYMQKAISGQLDMLKSAATEGKG